MQIKYRQYVKNLTTYFGALIIPMLLGLVANPWIAKNMSPEDYAVSGYYTSFSSLISPIIIFYLIHYYIKEYFRRDEEGRIILFALIAKATIWFSGIISILCFVVLFAYQNFFNPDLSFPIMPYLALLVFAIPLTGLLNLQLARFRMEKRTTAFFRLSIANGLLNILLTLIFVVWLKWGAFGKLLSPLVCNSIIFSFLCWQFRHVFKIKTSFRKFKTTFKFCLPLALSAMLGYFTNSFTTTYLEGLGKTTEYGYYIVGSSIASYLSTFSTAIGNTFQPDLYETCIKKSWRRYFYICVLEITSFVVFALFFVVCAPFIISILTAGRYIASTPYSQIIAFSTITSGIYYIINQFTIATNRPHLYLYTSILGSIFIVLAMPFLVKRWEFIGGAWMTVISYIALSLINIALLIFIKQPVKQ